MDKEDIIREELVLSLLLAKRTTAECGIDWGSLTPEEKENIVTMMYADFVRNVAVDAINKLDLHILV